jgi:hypothetical protein
VDEAFAYWDRAIAEMKAAVPTVIAEEAEESPSEGAEGLSEERKGSPSAAPPVLEVERMRAEITAEVYVTLARGLLPMAADAMAGVRNEATEQRNILQAELARVRQLERAGRLVAAQEEHQAEAAADADFENFRLWLDTQHLEAS